MVGRSKTTKVVYINKSARNTHTKWQNDSQLILLTTKMTFFEPSQPHIRYWSRKIHLRIITFLSTGTILGNATIRSWSSEIHLMGWHGLHFLSSFFSSPPRSSKNPHPQTNHKRLTFSSTRVTFPSIKVNNNFSFPLSFFLQHSPTLYVFSI